MGKTPERLAKPPEIASYLEVSVATLAQWRYLGEGPPFLKAGHAVRYRWADVHEWLAAQRRISTRSA